MNVNPGALNKRITIFKKPDGTDADGYSSGTETEVYACWAMFTRISGTEAIKAGADFTDIKVRFLIRHTKVLLDRKMIIRYGGADYEIVYLNDYGDLHEYTEIWCSRLTQEGK